MAGSFAAIRWSHLLGGIFLCLLLKQLFNQISIFVSSTVDMPLLASGEGCVPSAYLLLFGAIDHYAPPSITR